MGNLYDTMLELVGVSSSTSGYNSNVTLCCCICVVVSFALACKLIFKGFDRLLGYNNIIK